MMSEKTTVEAEVEIPDEEIETVAEETARMAQRVVAAYAEDADECRMLLSMLGISPVSKLD
ncbi:hypothetical protein CJ178_25255 [Rhodococcus sp. ACPA4]|uniref:Uncharacterized protein n=2 Tax=Nocardiaceae TaxID=85025 RepID=A0ABU4C172_RHOGO|nr:MULTISPECIES: hypothetical protein [Rhodococcus]NMD60806.1 hypothetical protein [Nocardia globerula]MCE4264061.1 hypothetical protein [Rhodococcus globerulus]MDV6270054.1 hypothetical protein [Rhodococcus globerulus]MDV8066964.1 hypothetical protein [Rhodococcus sp. IEGM 1366]NRI65335.1 hypothetical protein [Rhodococcus sp. MS16]